MSASKEQSAAASSEKSIVFPFTVEDFKKANLMSVGILQVGNFERTVEEDYWIYRRAGCQQVGLLKTVLHLPGTGFINFNTVNADTFCPALLELLSSDTQIIVALSPEAPQHKFPTPVLHLQRTLTHLLEKADQYRIDKANIIFGGYSSGGTLTIPLAIYFAKRQVFFKNILIMSPVFDYSGMLRDNQELKNRWQAFEKKDNRYLNWGFIDFMNGIYSNSKEDLTHPWYSPIYTPIDELKCLGKVCFIYGEHDFVRRDIEAFKDRLAEAEVACETILLEQEGHRCYMISHLTTVVLEPTLKQAMKAKKIDNLRILAKHLNHVLQ